MFTLQHGQAFVERGFSINSDLLKRNMLERTIVSQRIITDSVSSILTADPNAVQNIVIDKEMLRHCHTARIRYHNFLDENREVDHGIKTPVENVQMARKKDELEKEKKKVISFEKEVQALNKEADELALKAELKQKMCMLSESNTKRKRADSMASDLAAMRAKVMKLQSEVEKLK